MKTNKKLILLVEDDSDQAEEIITIIKNTNKYDALWAKNGKEALQLLKNNSRLLGLIENKIRCILLDLHMPEMNGLEFIETLRKKEKKHLFPKFLPVVFLTAHEDEQKWQRAIANFTAGYLRKPFKKQELEKIIDQILEDWDHDTMIEINKQKWLKKYQINNFKKKSLARGRLI